MTETDVSRRVAKVAVRVVQRDFERAFASGLGELGHTMDLDYVHTKIIHVHWIINIRKGSHKGSQRSLL